MEDLFWTTLNLDGTEEAYHIIFENDEYCFIPQQSFHATYKFKREHDEWHAVDAPSEEIKDKAIDALEKYLLKQH